MTLFRLDASIRAAGSHTRELADLVQEGWAAQHPDAPRVHRDIGTAPLPADAWAGAVAGGALDAGDRSEAQRTGIALAAELTDELVAADAFLFAVPLYNFGVSQHFKAWVDLVLTDPRMQPHTEPVLRGRPAVLVTARGGAYGPGTPREGWDHATGWMARILADVWRLDLRTVETELTLVGVNPALDHLHDVAQERRATATAHARESGEALAVALARVG